MIVWTLPLYLWHCAHHRDADYTHRVVIDCRMGAHKRCRWCACPCHDDRHAALLRLVDEAGLT